MNDRSGNGVPPDQSIGHGQVGWMPRHVTLYRKPRLVLACRAQESGPGAAEWSGELHNFLSKI